MQVCADYSRALIFSVGLLCALPAGCQMHVAFGPSTPGSPGDIGNAASLAQNKNNPGESSSQIASTGNSSAKPRRSSFAKFPQSRQHSSQQFVRKTGLKPSGNSKPEQFVLPRQIIQPSTHKEPQKLATFILDEDATLTNVPLVPPAPGVESSSSNSPTTLIQDENPPVADLGLAEVLQLAGAQNWAVNLAAERISEAQARHDAAKVMWLPTLNAGIGYTKHDGKIQATSGQVLDVSRNSLFVGGGAVTGSGPNTGGSGGPARLFVDLSLTDAIFQPRSTIHLLDASQAGHVVAFNDTLLAASLTYYDLVSSQARLRLATKNLKLTTDLLNLTKSFARAGGKGTQADVARVDVEVERRNQEIVEAKLASQLASAELVRILRIDIEAVAHVVNIKANDTDSLPIHLLDPNTPLNELILQASTSRPEISESYSKMESAREKMSAETWRPWIPNLHVGVSSGGFGGGTGDNLNNFDGRADVDLLAVWQVKNLGFGTAAARRASKSRYQQAHFEYHRVRDRITSEVAKAYAEVRFGLSRMKIASLREQKADDAHDRSMKRIKGFLGIPMEALQAVQAVVLAREESLKATVDYNRAQLKLLRAVGNSISSNSPTE